MAQVKAALTVQVDGRALTPKQALAVLTLYLEGTQRAAARKLGLSAPVINRHLRQVEAKVGAPIMSCGPRGTELNELGERIAKEQMVLQGKLREREHLVVGCTPLSEGRLLQALNAVDPLGEAQLVISEDRYNVTEFQAGMLDLVLLDDPLFAYELDGDMEEVGRDNLLHFHRGNEYARYRFGPQRLGFQYLDSLDQEYRVVRTYSSLSALLRSGYSHFVSESLLMGKGRLPRGADASLPYSLICVYRSSVTGTEELMRALRPDQRG
ncbi:MAG: LysR family transcriptional regulator [Methanomassiliicoccales archaeon]|nr:LysR family transcriptional regulator [Methanomassiliicoccales archaeon]